MSFRHQNFQINQLNPQLKSLGKKCRELRSKLRFEAEYWLTENWWRWDPTCLYILVIFMSCVTLTGFGGQIDQVSKFWVGKILILSMFFLNESLSINEKWIYLQHIIKSPLKIRSIYIYTMWRDFGYKLAYRRSYSYNEIVYIVKAAKTFKFYLNVIQWRKKVFSTFNLNRNRNIFLRYNNINYFQFKGTTFYFTCIN